MRQIITDAARARSTQKRGGNNLRYAIQDADGTTDAPALELANIHDLLTNLREQHPRQTEVFELRAFGALTFANLLGISESSARLDWQFARVWIRNHLDPTNS